MVPPPCPTLLNHSALIILPSARATSARANLTSPTPSRTLPALWVNQKPAN